MNGEEIHFHEEFDEELQHKVYKRIRKKELKASMTLACMLVLFSYFGAYAAYFVVGILSSLFPVLNKPFAAWIAEAAVYCIELLVPYFIYTGIREKKLCDIVFPDGMVCDEGEREKAGCGTVISYSVIAFSLSQITATLSSFFTLFITAFISLFHNGFVLDPQAFDVPIPETVDVFILNFISVAILPAILEELVFRGVLLCEFMKYGKTFAITASALFFASVHGSIEQMMYSFVYGLIFGYVAVKTGSLIVGMIMHFLNNAYSCIVEYAGSIWNTDIFWNMITAVNFLLIFTGLVCIVYKAVHGKIGYYERTDADKGPNELCGHETFSVFVSPVMLLYYAFVLFETLYVYLSYSMRI